MATIFRLCKISAMLIFIGFFVGCATVSFKEPKNNSIAMQDVGDTALGQIVANDAKQHNGLSGFYPLSEGMDALDPLYWLHFRVTNFQVLRLWLHREIRIEFFPKNHLL